MQHQGVGDWHGQPECVYYLQFLDYGLFYEDGVIDEQGVHFDFHPVGMGVSALADEVSYCVDDVKVLCRLQFLQGGLERRLLHLRLAFRVLAVCGA